MARFEDSRPVDFPSWWQDIERRLKAVDEKFWMEQNFSDNAVNYVYAKRYKIPEFLKFVFCTPIALISRFRDGGACIRVYRQGDVVKFMEQFPEANHRIYLQNYRQ